MVRLLSIYSLSRLPKADRRSVFQADGREVILSEDGKGLTMETAKPTAGSSSPAYAAKQRLTDKKLDGKSA
jgi:hypothetical protein